MEVTSGQMKSPWQFRLRPVQLPKTPPEGWIRLEVEACGVCGSDLADAAEDTEEWKAFGHEIAGTVQAVGPGVERIGPGARVVLESSSFCGQCELCHDGRVDLCVGKVPGFWEQEAMGFSEEMLAPARCAVPYEGLSPEVASLTEPAGVAFDMVKVAGIQMGQRVCVVGPGPIGLAAAALAARRGASRLACIGHTHSKARLALAESLGAEVIPHDGPLDELTELAEGFDHVLMTAPTQVIVPGLSLLRYGGVMTYIGIGTGDPTISFDANKFHFRKLQLRASFAAPAIYFPAVLRLLRAGMIPGEEMISHTFSLQEIGKAMAACREKKETAVKVIVKPD